MFWLFCTATVVIGGGLLAWGMYLWHQASLDEREVRNRIRIQEAQSTLNRLSDETLTELVEAIRRQLDNERPPQGAAGPPQLGHLAERKKHESQPTRVRLTEVGHERRATRRTADEEAGV